MTIQAMNNSSLSGSNFVIDWKKIWAQAHEIFTNPKGCWTKLLSEFTSDKDFLLNYFAPIVLIPTIANFIRNVFIGYNVPVIGLKTVSFFSGLGQAILFFAINFLMLFVGTFIIEKLVPYFKGSPNHAKVLRFVGYSATPGCFASFFVLLPGLGTVIQLVGSIFGIFVFWYGITEMTGVPADQKVKFALTTVASTFAIGLILGLILIPRV